MITGRLFVFAMPVSPFELERCFVRGDRPQDMSEALMSSTIHGKIAKPQQVGARSAGVKIPSQLERTRSSAEALAGWMADSYQQTFLPVICTSFWMYGKRITLAPIWVCQLGAGSA